MSLPIGTIILWTDANIPTGWSKCDGSNGTPNLVSRFVRGATSNGQLRTTGGTTSHSHTNTALSAAGGHGHTGISGTSGNSGTEMYYGGSNETGADNHSHSLSADVTSETDHTHTVGSTQADADTSMPPYKILIYIMKTVD